MVHSDRPKHAYLSPMPDSRIRPLIHNKLDGNLDFNMGNTEFLAKGPTYRHVYERAQYFLQTDSDLQGIVNDFTPDMFTVTGIEVLGAPIGTDAYIKDCVSQNSRKIMPDNHQSRFRTLD